MRDRFNLDENTPARMTQGVLEIKENHRCEEIEEIDLNSPERRRQATRKEEEISRLEIKKKKKKLSHDERNRVIRFTTGEPYLEYLPNMLSKDASVPLSLFRRRKCRRRKNWSSIVDWEERNRKERISTSKTTKTSSHPSASKNTDILFLLIIS